MLPVKIMFVSTLCTDSYNTTAGEADYDVPRVGANLPAAVTGNAVQRGVVDSSVRIPGTMSITQALKKFLDY